MDLENIILSEVRQTEGWILCDVTYMCNLKYDTKELIYETETDSDIENRLLVAEGEGGMDWDFRISRWKPLYTQWINNKVLLYSTRNYITI